MVQSLPLQAGQWGCEDSFQQGWTVVVSILLIAEEDERIAEEAERFEKERLYRFRKEKLRSESSCGMKHKEKQIWVNWCEQTWDTPHEIGKL